MRGGLQGLALTRLLGKALPFSAEVCCKAYFMDLCPLNFRRPDGFTARLLGCRVIQVIQVKKYKLWLLSDTKNQGLVACSKSCLRRLEGLAGERMA